MCAIHRADCNTTMGSWLRSVKVAVIPGFSDAGGCGRPPRFRTLVTGAHNCNPCGFGIFPGIIIGPEKCQFGTTELSFLGHHVCAEGISPLPSAVDAVVNFVKPEKQRALRRYLGMVNYYHRFIPHCAAKLTPLNNLLTAANEGHTWLSPKSNFDLE